MPRKAKGEGEDERGVGKGQDEEESMTREEESIDEEAVLIGFFGVSIPAEEEAGGVALCRSLASSPDSSLLCCSASAAARNKRFVVPVALVSPERAEQTKTRR